MPSISQPLSHDTLPHLPREIQTIILDFLLQITPLHSRAFQDRLVISHRAYDLHIERLYEDVVLHKGNVKRFTAALDARCREDLLQVTSSLTRVTWSDYPSSAARKWALMRTTKRLTIKDRQAMRAVGQCVELYRTGTSTAPVGDNPRQRAESPGPVCLFPSLEWLVFTSVISRDESSALINAEGKELAEFMSAGFHHLNVCIQVASEGEEVWRITGPGFWSVVDECGFSTLTMHNARAGLPLMEGLCGPEVNIFLEDIDSDDEEAVQRQAFEVFMETGGLFEADSNGERLIDRYNEKRHVSIAYYNATVSFDDVMEAPSDEDISDDEWETIILDFLLQITPLHSREFQDRLLISRRAFDLHVVRLFKDIVLHKGNAKLFVQGLDAPCREEDLLPVMSPPTRFAWSDYTSSAARKWALVRKAKRLTIKDRQATSAVGLRFTVYQEVYGLSEAFIEPHVCVQVAFKGRPPGIIPEGFSGFLDECKFKSLTMHNSLVRLPLMAGHTDARVHVFLGDVEDDDDFEDEDEAITRQEYDLAQQAEWFFDRWTSSGKLVRDRPVYGDIFIAYYNAEVSFDDVLESLGDGDISDEEWEERQTNFRVYEKGDNHGYVCRGCGRRR
ncbi:hypothetical protein IAT38_005260 [Cryptococcus sp. DSM 104549]